MVRSLAALAAMAIALIPAAAATGSAVGEAAVEMTAWVADVTGYDAPPPPTVTFADQSVLRELCYPGCDDGDDLPKVLGVYDPRVGIILLDEAFDGGEARDRSTLLHEVVHHVQEANDARARARCKQELEGEALRLQIRWLHEQEGIDDPLAFLGINEFTLRILGSC